MLRGGIRHDLLDEIQRASSEKQLDVVDDMLDSSETATGRTLWSAIKPVADGVGEARLIKPIGVNNLLLLPGDILLSKFEQDLYQSWSESFLRRVRGYRGTAALSALVNEVAAANHADFVFYDSGPNIGPLNRVILLDCDYFIVPAACDSFSVRAFKTLGQTLADWIRDWSTAVFRLFLFQARDIQRLKKLLHDSERRNEALLGNKPVVNVLREVLGVTYRHERMLSRPSGLLRVDLAPAIFASYEPL